jgi:hypothetical protein
VRLTTRTRARHDAPFLSIHYASTLFKCTFFGRGDTTPISRQHRGGCFLANKESSRGTRQFSLDIFVLQPLQVPPPPPTPPPVTCTWPAAATTNLVVPSTCTNVAGSKCTFTCAKGLVVATGTGSQSTCTSAGYVFAPPIPELRTRYNGVFFYYEPASFSGRWF